MVQESSGKVAQKGAKRHLGSLAGSPVYKYRDSIHIESSMQVSGGASCWALLCNLTDELYRTHPSQRAVSSERRAKRTRAITRSLPGAAHKLEKSEHNYIMQATLV